MELFTYCLGFVALTGIVMLTLWATFFCAVMPVLVLVGAADGPSGGRLAFFKDDSDLRAEKQARRTV